LTHILQDFLHILTYFTNLFTRNFRFVSTLTAVAQRLSTRLIAFSGTKTVQWPQNCLLKSNFKISSETWQRDRVLAGVLLT